MHKSELVVIAHYGAAGGLELEEKVRLYINAGTLEKSGVELKPLVLKVAKVHR